MINFEYFKQNKDESFINLFFLFVPLMYVIGPAVLDLYITISSTFLLIFLYFKKKIYINRLYIIFLIIIFFYLNFVSIINYESNNSIYRSLFFIRYIIIFLSITSIFYFYQNIKIKYFFFTSAILVYFIFLNQVYQLFFGIDILGNEAEKYRLSGIFGNNLIAGQVLFILSMPAIFFSFSIRKKKISYLFLITTSIIILIGIFLSGQRTALYNYILAFLIYLYLFKDLLKINFIKMFLSLILILTSFIYFVPTFYHRFFETTLKQINNFLYTSYSAHFETAIIVWLNNPFFGVGLKNYRNVCSSEIYISKYTANPCSSHPHNIYLEILSELGFVGLILFVTLFLFYLISIFKIFKKLNYNYMFMTFPFYITTIPIILSFLPSGSFFTNTHSIPFWLYFSIAVSSLNFKHFNNH